VLCVVKTNFEIIEAIAKCPKKEERGYDPSYRLKG
jgi:hypothetical protein